MSVIFVVMTKCEEVRGERIQFSEGLKCSMTGCVILSDELFWLSEGVRRQRTTPTPWEQKQHLTQDYIKGPAQDLVTTKLKV